MVRDTGPRSHHPGSPLFGGRPVSSSRSHSLLRKLSSLTKRSEPQQTLSATQYAMAPSSLLPSPSSPSSPTSPNRMALAAAQTATHKARTTTSSSTTPRTRRPVANGHANHTNLATRIPSAVSVSCNAPLVVQVEIRFPGLENSTNVPSYAQEYSSSPGLVVSDRLCKGLLRRITHCSNELITRRDSKALMQQHRKGHPASIKPVAYELHFRILRKDAVVWVEKSFYSYQKQLLTSYDAHEVILATHRMVGLFLRRHDSLFHWADAPETDTTTFAPRRKRPELVRHIVDHPLPLTCVPRSRFLANSQSFEFVPGYAITLSFRSRCHSRQQYEWKRDIKLQSNQSAPLNLASAEDLLWQTHDSVNNALAARRQAFLKEHEACELVEGEGIATCRYFDEDALDIKLSIKNNLGPNFDYLTRTIRSKLALFRHPDGTDCHEFIQAVHKDFLQAREIADNRANSLPDFDLRILTLRSPAWSVDNPARFVLDAATSHSRHTVEAILDRVQTGISDVLRNKDFNIHVVAYKRGHLILDKALTTHSAPPKPTLFPMIPTGEDQDAIISRLKKRIHRDLNAVCKDTCALDDVLEAIGGATTQVGETYATTLTENSIPSPSAADKFQDTVIIDGPAVVEDEANAPAPRVIELPDNMLAGDSHLSPPSPTSSTRRRAFPLVPEKFTLPCLGSTSANTINTSPLSEEQLPTDPALELEQEAVLVPESMLVETSDKLPPVEELSTEEAPAESPIMNEPPSVDIRVDDALMKEAPLEELPLELLPAEEVTVEESQPEEPRSEELRARELATEIFHQELPVYVPGTSTVQTDISSDEGDGDFVDAEEFHQNSSQHLSTLEVGDEVQPVQILQEHGTTFDSQPFFYNFDDTDEQPSVELRFEPHDSPTVGTVLETIAEYDSDTDSEFHFELPSYDQGLPFMPLALPSQPCHSFPETTRRQASRSAESEHLHESHDNHGLFERSDAAAEALFEASSDSYYASESGDDEPILLMSPSGHDHDGSILGRANTFTTGSSNATRPSTPSLSLSSGEFNSPETSFLATPSVAHEPHATILSCFDSEGDANFRQACDVQNGLESESRFSQFVGNHNPSSQHITTGDSPFGHPFTAPMFSKISASSISGSRTDNWREVVNTADLDRVYQIFTSESERDASTPTSSPDVSFEDFAMTKPTLDVDLDDNYSEVASESESLKGNDKVLGEQFVPTQVDRDNTIQPPEQESCQLQDAEPDMTEQEADGCTYFAVDGLSRPELVPLPDSDSESDEDYQLSTELDSVDRDQQLDLATSQCPRAELSFEVDSIEAAAVKPGLAIDTDLIFDMETIAEPELPTEPEPPASAADAKLDAAANLTAAGPVGILDIVEVKPVEAELIFETLSAAEAEFSTGAEFATDTDVVEVEPVPEAGSVEAETPSDSVHVQDMPQEQVAELTSDGGSAPSKDPSDSQDELVDPEVQADPAPVKQLPLESEDLQSEEWLKLTDAEAEISPNELPKELPKELHAELAIVSEFAGQSDKADGLEQHAENASEHVERSENRNGEVANMISEAQIAADIMIAGNDTFVLPLEATGPVSQAEGAAQGSEYTSLNAPRLPLGSTAAESSTSDNRDMSCSKKPRPGSIHPIVDAGGNDLSLPPKRTISWSLPRSGFVGLDETRLVKVGLRSALTGSHAFDNVPFQVPKHRSGHGSQPSITEEVVASPSEAPKRGAALVKVPKRARTVSTSPKPVAAPAPASSLADTKEGPLTSQEGVLPRVILAFASMAIMSQMINKSS